MKSLRKSDFIEVYVKYEGGMSVVLLKLYVLDLLRIMDVLKNARNDYYYSELRWFLNEISKVDKRFGAFEWDRSLPRIKLKEKKKWELDTMLAEL